MEGKLIAYNNLVYIPSIDGKDIYLSNTYDSMEGRKSGYSLMTKDGQPNLKRYVNTLDYSLDQIKIREVYEKVYRRKDFGFCIKGKEFSGKVINVTFKYSVAEYNKLGSNVYIKKGFYEKDVVFDDCTCVVNGALAGITLNSPVEAPISAEVLGKCFSVARLSEKKKGVTTEFDAYVLVKQPKTILNTAAIRTKLYNEGFMCGGVRYIRWKRSSGSSRVGKCLFIDERLYGRMHKWEMRGLKVKYGQEVDLAALESYISLSSSSIIDTIEIKPENILVINDFESVFRNKVISIEELNGRLTSEEKECDIVNSIWDGQSILDKSAFGDYSDKGMLLLRNLFFKSCCFNGEVQKWFADNNIKSISQLNGFTVAKKVSDIKLITTPSSIKYLKFGTLEQWLSLVGNTYGVVKYDKPTHFFDGRMVQTHYQLLNTVQMSKDETGAFLQETFDYMSLLKSDPAAMRYHIKYPIEEEVDISPAESKNNIIYKMIGINDKFADTKLYHDFKSDLLKALNRTLKLGHVLVNGNYSTLLGNPIEMLQMAIGKFDEKSQIGIGNVHSTRFPYGTRLLGSRSPHVSISNVLLTNNRANEKIDNYINLTNEIVCVNSINENLLQKLAGCDFDSDTVLLTDNAHLIKAAAKNDGRFLVAVNNVSSTKTKRFYTYDEQADLDIKTSNNLIGDIINIAQELNTMIWHKLNNGCSLKSVNDIYIDVCKLSIMSGLEIDKAKRELPINNAKELVDLREKYTTKEDGRNIKPNFFAVKDRSKGFYNSEKKYYKRHKTTMDYLQECVNCYSYATRGLMSKDNTINFSELIDDTDYVSNNITGSQVSKIVNMVNTSTEAIKKIYVDYHSELDVAHTLASKERQDMIEEIGNITFTRNTMIYLLKLIEQPEYRDVRRRLFNTLFGYPNTSFYTILKNSSNGTSYLEEDGGGTICIYGKYFSKMYNIVGKSAVA